MACLQYLHNNNCPWDYRLVAVAIAAKRVDIAKYAIEHKCHVKHNALRLAAIKGCTEAVQYLLSIGVKMEMSQLTDVVVRNGQIEVLK